ncbi:lasso RiPP family leader peptide-containing protein [Sphaerimonospora cavernae]|uniref:Lasso RiPP family leader peptide-containing protein n=1 Tax=Sphaerimonospora cavernae TaxID=1740611 RepID=A0ABV6U5G7_9ACTN
MNKQTYSTPALVELGDVRSVVLGSSNNDTADMSKYYN